MENGEGTDSTKITAVQQWPVPQNLNQLCGFLGLTGYYKRFICNYGLLSQPLTALLEKDAFCWNQGATVAFMTLKAALSSTPILTLPDFAESSGIETDASNLGIGAVLIQQGHPVAFISKALSSICHSTPTYGRELYAILFAVKKW